MNAPAFTRNPAFERVLARDFTGAMRFDAATRGRYATDASIYQIMPAGVAFPASTADVAAALAAGRAHGVPVIARGGGTSQNGQPVGAGLVLDFSCAMDKVIAYDREAGTITVEPGLVLERLNTRLKSDGWFFPVEPSTASRCTIGGMAGNNACGARSIRYGKMVNNVLAIEGLAADGTPIHFARDQVSGADALTGQMRALALELRDEIERRFPKVQRRVGGYNLDELLGATPNFAGLLVGSEGTLALSTAITLKLSRLPAHRVIGVCQFASFRAAMEATRHLVALGPVAVELVDRNILTLGEDIPLFRDTLSAITRGRPDALLIVEFAGEDHAALLADLTRLDIAMSDLGHPDSVTTITDAAAQRRIWDVREACLNIMMSMKGDAKPVSFIEDCAVPLDRLADYTAEIEDVFARNGTRGTWYAHASVGCLHVRPILDMKSAGGVAAMRAIAEEACDLVRRFEGSFSGEHGDGLSRSEFIEPMFGEALTRSFAQVKDAFDPDGVLNPGKITRAPKFDDRSLMRFPEGYATVALPDGGLDWSRDHGFAAAVEMCNNNGTCRKFAGGGMCPSWRVTREESDVTRGRANTLRLALSGQLGPDALTGPEVAEALSLCVSCKACRRECPTGVDMARMKIEVLAQRAARHGIALRERLVAALPALAGFAPLLGPLTRLRNAVPLLARLMERISGISATRSLPVWQKPWRDAGAKGSPNDVAGDGRDLILFADSFNRAFEPENLIAAKAVLRAAGYRLHTVMPHDGGRALCCGRTRLAAGMVAAARAEIGRIAQSMLPFVARGARIVGLEPSCLLTLRDEIHALLPAAEAAPIAQAAFLFEEVLEADLARGIVTLDFADQGGRIGHLHGHCHQKAFDALTPVEKLLGRVPGLTVKTIESACCGMAGAFGFQAETIATSRAMAELSLLPHLRAAGADDLVIADGTSCRHQIADGINRKAVHVAVVLAGALQRA